MIKAVGGVWTRRASLAALVVLSTVTAAWAQTAQAKKPVATAEPAPAAKMIVLGQSVPLTGPSSDLGLKMRAGAAAYFAKINAEGGVHGAQIELRTLDDGYEPERSKKNTEKLLADGAFALFGYVGTPTSLASRPAFEAAKAPFLFAFTGTGALRSPQSPLIFNMRASYGQETERMVDHLWSFGIRRIGIVYQNDAYGQAGLAGMKAALDKRKSALTVEATVERNSSEVAGAVRKIAQTNPQAVVIVTTYGATAEFVKAYKRTGLAQPQFFNVSFVGTAALQKALGAEAEGVVVAQVVPPYSDTSLSSVREFHEVMRQAKMESFVDYTSFEGFLAAKLTVEGLRRAGPNPTREALVRGLEEIKNYDIGGVYVSFGPNQHSGSEYVDLTMLRKNGSILY